MITITKEDRHTQEHKIFQARGEIGIIVFRDWLYDRQTEINRKWPEMAGDDLIRIQGEARLIARQIKMIEKGPTVPQQSKEGTHG